jgi:VIT1/CCC1 family predicted Fe2+/Mn2+ transporter
LTPNLLHGIEEAVFLPTPHTFAFTVVIVVVVVVGFAATAWGMASMASKMEWIFPG